MLSGTITKKALTAQQTASRLVARHNHGSTI